MTKYLITFHSSGMDDLTEADFVAAGDESRAVVREAKEAGVWVFGGGIAEDVPSVMVTGDGVVTDGSYPAFSDLRGGFTVLEVPNREEALQWARKIAVSCRCTQQVREFMYDPES